MSATTRNQVFSAVHTVGGLLPADMLVRISESKEGKDVPGSGPADYHVIGPRRSVRDEAERHWDYLKAIWRELRDKLPVSAESELPADPTGLAVDQWLEPLFNELGFGRLTTVAAGSTAPTATRSASSPSATAGTTCPSTWPLGTPCWTSAPAASAPYPRTPSSRSA